MEFSVDEALREVGYITRSKRFQNFGQYRNVQDGVTNPILLNPIGFNAWNWLNYR